MRTIIAVCVLLVPSSLAGRYDTELLDNLDKFCYSFTEWQIILKSKGFPQDKYVVPGMEAHCPNAIIE